MNRTIMLGLMLLCRVYSPNPRELQLAEELQRAGVIVEGIWDINDPESLMHPETGMCNYRALWGWGYDKDGKLLCGYYKDGKYLGGYDKDGKRLWGYDKDGKYLGGYDKDGKALWEYNGDENCFTFKTIGEVRALEQELREGKGLRRHLVLYKDLSQIWKSGTKIPSFLYLDPRGLFFAIDQTTPHLPSSFWTLNKAFFEASASPEKMAEFQKQIEISELEKQEKIRREQAPEETTPLVTQEEFNQGLERMSQNIRELQAKLEISERKSEEQTRMLESMREETANREQATREATAKREEEMLKKMDDMRNMIEVGLRFMMQSFLQRDFVRSPDASSSASAAPVRVAPRAIMDRIIEENSQPQNFDQQMQEIHENLDRTMYQLKCMFAPTPPANEAPVVETGHEAHEHESEWSRRLEEVATPPLSEPKSPGSAAAAASEVLSSDLSQWSVIGPGGGTIEGHK